jgi:rhamnose utilization protein RhaD (predicted bifunctional aldolase and dehydrogenase)/NAD(P)-dependent dehydrogenase (short-subunit alcohol dehydrogenase family)
MARPVVGLRPIMQGATIQPRAACRAYRGHDPLVRWSSREQEGGIVKYLRDLWHEQTPPADGDELGLLRYRSNLLGADQRITNYGGGNTSGKFDVPDPVTGEPVRVLAVKGSGGDLGTMGSSGFALLDLARLHQLRESYRGEAHEDGMVAHYPRFSVANHGVAPSIDTPLHAFLPFDHVDHLHPDWAIALAASANGKDKLDEFNGRFTRNLIWVPWQRPGFELALMLRRAVEEHPGAEGIILASHGLFTWGSTSHECYLNTAAVIDDLGTFVLEHQQKIPPFGGPRHATRADRDEIATAILPFLRGRMATLRPSIGIFDDSEESLDFVNARDADALAEVGTSCPDHFVRTRIKPLLVQWDPAAGTLDTLRDAIVRGADQYRREYTAYYESFATPQSPRLRDPNPSVVLVAGVGTFAFGATRKEARYTAEFYRNAIRVMAGATALGGGRTAQGPLSQPKSAEKAAGFTAVNNYVALPGREAFNIEYWALEEAKLQRMPPPKALSRRVCLIVGGANGIGRATALKAAALGAHLVIADLNEAAASEAALEVGRVAGADAVAACAVDTTSRESIRRMLHDTVHRFGGLDIVVNTAAVFPSPDLGGRIKDEQWQSTFTLNVTANYLLADEAAVVLDAQQTPAAIVLTSSANAVVPKKGSEAYDVSKSAVNHLVRELAIRLAPNVRVNAIAPATVVSGSTMFPRDRVMSSLTKYGIAWSDEESTDDLRDKLARFYAGRTLLNQPITPDLCAEAILWLAGDRSGRTTGHVIPVDGGLPEAFLR